MLSSNDSSLVLLKSPDDWDTWDKQFKAEATRKNLLEQVNGTALFDTKPGKPELRRFLPQRICTRTIAELTPDRQANYQLAYTIYKNNMDQYNKQQDALDKLQTWMMKTVAANYAKTCFNYEKDIKNWYSALKQQVGTNEYAIKQEIKNAYKQAVKSLSKIPKNIKS